MRMYRRNVTEKSECRFLTLDYRCCDRKRPKFIKHVEIEAIAAPPASNWWDGVDAIAFDALRQIDRLKINGIDFALEVSTDCEVHDEDGNHVFGICEFDPGAPDTAMVSCRPSAKTPANCWLWSTLAHELGHAVFDAPGWIMDGSKGRDCSMPRTSRCSAPTAPPRRTASTWQKYHSPISSNGDGSAFSPSCVPTNSWARCWCPQLP